MYETKKMVAAVAANKKMEYRTMDDIPDIESKSLNSKKVED